MPKEKEKEKDKEAEELETPQKKGGLKGLLLVVIMLLIVLIVGGAAALYLLVFKTSEPVDAAPPIYDFTDPSGGTAQPGTVQQQQPRGEPGPIVAYPPFLVNLADPGGSRYLKTTLSIELSKEKNFPAEVLAKEPRIKDIVISVLASKTFNEVSTHQGKIALKQEMLRKLNTIMSSGRIVDIYITEFVIQ